MWVKLGSRGSTKFEMWCDACCCCVLCVVLPTKGPKRGDENALMPAQAIHPAEETRQWASETVPQLGFMILRTRLTEYSPQEIPLGSLAPSVTVFPLTKLLHNTLLMVIVSFTHHACF